MKIEIDKAPNLLTDGFVKTINGDGTLNVDTNGYVPYTGATADVDLGANDFTTTGDITGTQFDALSSHLTNHQSNGDFATGDFTNWTAAADWNVVSEQAVFTRTAGFTSGTLTGDFAPTAGVSYRITFDWSRINTSNGISYTFAGNPSIVMSGLSGTEVAVLPALSTAPLVITAGSFSVQANTVIDNVKVETTTDYGFKATGLIETQYNGGAIVGDSLNLNVNTLSYAGTFGFDMNPTTTRAFDLGSSTLQWDNIYSDDVYTNVVRHPFHTLTNVEIQAANASTGAVLLRANNEIGLVVNGTGAQYVVTINEQFNDWDFQIRKQTSDTLFYADVSASTIAIDGNLLFGDSDKIFLGTANDSSIYYDGTNLVINPKEVGSGYLQVDGRVGIGTASPNSNLQVAGSVSFPYVAKTANYTATIDDHTIDCTTNTFTVTLPTAVGITGRIYNIKNSGVGTITVATTSSQTIDGVTTQTLNQYDKITVQSTGSNFIII